MSGKGQKNKAEIIKDLKSIIQETFKMKTENIESDTLLFDGGLSLNSIQMIELTVSIENFYGKRFDSSLLLENNFRSIDILSETIMKNLIL